MAMMATAEHTTIIGNRVHLAPLAGVADPSFRLIARLFGAGPLMSEMVSAHAVQSGKSHKLVDAQLPLLGMEHPLALQLVGNDIDLLVRWSVYAQQCGVDHVNLNFACPVRKIVNSGKGAAMLKDPGHAFDAMKAVADAVDIPVTVKVRAGWDVDSINSTYISELAQKAGMKAVFLHGRTRAQAFKGKANWGLIKQAAAAVDIPVVGNGDIVTPADALAMVESTGCAAVMVGRGALGRPWLFAQILDAFREQEVYPREDLDLVYPLDLSPFDASPADFPVDALASGDGHTIASLIRLQLRLALHFKNEKVAVRELRKHLIWYSRGLEGASKFRSIIHTAETLEALESLVSGFFEKDY